MTQPFALLALGLIAGTAGSAHAGELYTGVGTHGLMLGYAQPVAPHVTLRADYASAGQRTRQEREEGIDYDTKITYNRIGLFADAFPFAPGGFRFTGGVTFNNMKADLDGRGNGGTINIGGTNYTMTANDRFNVKIEFPKTTPYIGIGYGHQLSTGWGFVFDFGASIGKAKVTETHSGPNLSLASQADIDRELAEIREGAGKVKAIPLIAIGFNYRF
jgi:hypothetical protein